MLDLNSNSEADFKEAGLELKTTPLKRNKDGLLAAKERLIIGMIDYMQVVHEEFETSHLMEKTEGIMRKELRMALQARPRSQPHHSDINAS